jgi:hypothetical protein
MSQASLQKEEIKRHRCEPGRDKQPENHGNAFNGSAPERAHSERLQRGLKALAQMVAKEYQAGDIEGNVNGTLESSLDHKEFREFVPAGKANWDPESSQVHNEEEQNNAA